MKITDLETSTVRIPLKVAKRFSTRTIFYRDYTIVQIHTDEGLTGWGYCWGTPMVSVAVNNLLKEYLLNENPLNISRLWDKMYHGTAVWGRRGIIIRAISAVDIALWDLLGKTSGLPIYKILGGYRDKVQVYYSGGYYPEPCKSEAQLLSFIQNEMETYREKGFKAFKMKVGGASLKLDLERIKIARSVIGEESELMLDANNAWNADTAIKMGRIFETYNIGWLEEPVPIDDISGCAKVAAALDVPIAIGENHFTRWDFEQIIERRAADILQGDPTLMGGISEWLKVAGAAALKNIPLAPHWTHDLNVQVGTGVKEVIYNEYFELESDVFNFQAVLQNPIKAVDGYIKPPEEPGHGLRLDMDAVKRYQLK
jgi:L-alanine-DL-glutamate epimerase-like enolase superfamily enzyme